MSRRASPAVDGGDAERVAALRLIRSEGIGPATFAALLAHYSTASAALDALPGLSARAGRKIRVCPADEAARELAALAKLGGRIVTLADQDYPPWLRQAEGAPPLLSVRGDSACLTRPTVAVVGSRNASVAGRKFAAMIARGLGERQVAIASGLARGIDAAAHQAALATGTVAVLAGGLDEVYPPEHAGLAEEIVAAGGALISEMPLGWIPRARDFPRRNRIVSGLALGVVVVEAAQRSGSLITARIAAEQGRLVFAVPGSPLDPRAAGANRLIREGAILVTGVEDVAEALGPMVGRMPEAAPAVREAPPPPPDDIDASDRGRVLEALGPSPIEIDEVIRFTGLGAAAVQLALIELDLAGRIERHPGQRVSLV